MLSDMAAELGRINEKVAALDSEIKSVAGADQDMRRLMEIPGVGPTIATALVAAVGNAKTFGKGRDLAAWLGLVPRQITTGGKAKLIGISKAKVKADIGASHAHSLTHPEAVGNLTSGLS